MATVQDRPNFTADGPAMTLHEGMEGWGSDPNVIIEMVSRHSNKQRQEIKDKYKAIYDEDLLKRLTSELRGQFEDITTALMTPPALYDARELNGAMAGVGTKESTLIEILCTRSRDEIEAIKFAYEKEFEKKLEEDIENETSGHFKQLLKDQINGIRDEQKDVNDSIVEQDAKAIYELQAGGDKWSTGVVDTMCNRSFAHLRAMFKAYAKLAGKDIEEELGEEPTSNLRDGLIAIVKIAKNVPNYFADRLFNAMKGYGTDDCAVIRIVVTRSEVDLAKIKPIFYGKYGQSLTDFFKEETGGDYMRMLVRILGTANASN